MNLFHVKHEPNDPYAHLHDHLTHLETILMATLAQINDAIAANTAATTALATAVQTSIGQNVDPASLDAPLAQINANTAAVQEAIVALTPAAAAPAAPTA